MMKIIPFIFMIGVGLIAIFLVYKAERYREAAIRALAIRYGFHYLGNALPRSLTLNGTPLNGISSVWNVIDGDPRGARVVAFDCRVGVGKGSWCRTVIAVKSDEDLLSPLAFTPEMVLDHSREWKILYRKKAFFSMRSGGLTPIEELAAYLKAFAG